MALSIRDLTARDIRFPTSRQHDGSDAMNRGDYSATYVVLETDATASSGHGLTFTNGRGNEVVVRGGARAGAAAWWGATSTTSPPTCAGSTTR